VSKEFFLVTCLEQSSGRLIGRKFVVSKIFFSFKWSLSFSQRRIHDAITAV